MDATLLQVGYRKLREAACLEDDVLVGFEEAEHAVEVELVEGRVEEIAGERGDHAAEERHPAELEAPERRHFLHGEQQAADGCRERRRHARRRPGRREVAPKHNRRHKVKK